MAVDPSMNNADKQLLRRQLVADTLPTQTVRLSDQMLPTQTVRPTFSDRFLNQPMPGTEQAHLNAGMAPERAAAIRAQDLAQPSNIFGIPTARPNPTAGPVLPTQTVRPDYSGAFLRGETGAMTAGQAGARQAAIYGGRMSAALDKTVAGPAAKADFSNVQGGATVGLRRLAPGVSRYALGGDVAGPNATPIYVTRGKHGEAVFTDNANFAAGQSTGSLRRNETYGDPGNSVYANAQENAQTNPNAGYEFSHQSTLNQHGLQRSDFQNLDPQATQAALALATAGGTSGEDGLANRMDANLLRARRFTQQQSAAAGASALDPKTQIALMRAQTDAAQGAERNAIAAGQLAETKRARDTADKNAARQETNDFFTQYNQMKATNDPQLGAYLSSAIPKDPKEFDDFAKTTRGQRILKAYMTDVLQPGAAASLQPAEWIDRGNVPGLTYSDMAIDPQAGFNGFNTADGSNQYPAQRGLLRRVTGLFKPGDSVARGSNYDGSINDFSPAILARMQKLKL